MDAARRKVSVISLNDTSGQLYTLVDGVPDQEDGEVSLKAPHS